MQTDLVTNKTIPVSCIRFVLVLESFTFNYFYICKPDAQAAGADPPPMKLHQ